MKRFKSLNRYYKAVILIMIAMTLVFGVIYPMVISRVGYEYMDRILVPSQEKDETVYSGTIQWQQACFTVSRDKTVVFQHGDKIYGPYTAKEDPAAIPAWSFTRGMIFCSAGAFCKGAIFFCCTMRTEPQPA